MNREKLFDWTRWICLIIAWGITINLLNHWSSLRVRFQVILAALLMPWIWITLVFSKVLFHANEFGFYRNRSDFVFDRRFSALIRISLLQSNILWILFYILALPFSLFVFESFMTQSQRSVFAYVSQCWESWGEYLYTKISNKLEN